MKTNVISQDLALRIWKIKNLNYPLKAKREIIASLVLRADPRFEYGEMLYLNGQFCYHCIFDGSSYTETDVATVYKLVYSKPLEL